jgi:hypothetical protein
MGRLLFVRDYIAGNHEFAEEDPGAHQVELMFECELTDESTPRLGDSPDQMQTGAEWVELGRLPELRLYPRAVARILARGLPTGTARYLGDVN